MKRLAYLLAVVLVTSIFLPIQSVFAQKSLPQVPITYAGDTNETIARRAQWIEGAKKEGSLNWWGSLTPFEAGKIMSEFNKVYPFIKVNVWCGKGEEIASKLEAEFAAGRISVDVCIGGEPYNYPRWRKIGMLSKFTDIIPNVKTMDKRMYSKHGDWAISGSNVITPQYHTNKASAAELPKGWEDLLDAKWKGKLGMTTDMKAWTTLALEEGGWGIEKTEDFLKKLKDQRLIWAPSHTAGLNLLIAGEYSILVENYWFQLMQPKKKGAPVEWMKVKPVPITGSSFSLQKNAPHPNAVMLYLEWQFSPQGLAIFDEFIGKGVPFPGSGTRVSKWLEGVPLVVRTEEGEQKAIESGLDKRFASLLGITQAGD